MGRHCQVAGDIVVLSVYLDICPMPCSPLGAWVTYVSFISRYESHTKNTHLNSFIAIFAWSLEPSSTCTAVHMHLSPKKTPFTFGRIFDIPPSTLVTDSYCSRFFVVPFGAMNEWVEGARSMCVRCFIHIYFHAVAPLLLFTMICRLQFP